eukprot:COSAG01_NODE_23184_length_825_cov_0.979339_2_plen_63_part_01
MTSANWLAIVCSVPLFPQSSVESAATGGAGHLVNFMGTDTMAGYVAARQYVAPPHHHTGAHCA